MLRDIQNLHCLCYTLRHLPAAYRKNLQLSLIFLIEVAEIIVNSAKLIAEGDEDYKISIVESRIAGVYIFAPRL